MRGIAKLLFGDDAARAMGLFDPDADQHELTERTRRSGEWCGTTPGRGSVAEALRECGRVRRTGLGPGRREF
jgi:hypothetical protein